MVPLLVESWIWWSVVMMIALSRYASRRMTFGSFRKFQADDYLMALVLCFYTTLIATINIVRHTSSNLLPPGYDWHQLTPQEYNERVYGSKLILVVEQCQCATIWGVKGCLVLLYMRLTTIHRENILIKILAGYVVGTYIVMEVLYFGVWCRPFDHYWALPTQRQCSAATDHLITNACFNLTSDVAMLLIVLPIFLRLKMNWRKKLPLIGIFSLGVFTIVAAVLNKVYSFSDPYGSLWTYWYVRESSTALIVANLPFVWTLWRKIPVLRALTGLSKSRSQNPKDIVSSRSKEDKVNTPTTADDWLSQDSVNNLEMDGAPGRDSGIEGELTLAEILGEQNPASKSDAEPTPITHPHLFYSRNPARAFGDKELDIEKAVLKDSPRQLSIQQGSIRDAHFEDTFDLRPYPSTTSKSNGSSSEWDLK